MKKYKWLWHVLDGETRFMLFNLVSDKRSTVEAKKVVRQAKETASQKPALFVTDGLFSYREAYRKELRDLHRNTTHVAGRSLKNTGNNNRIERLHGTVREREKVMRGMKSGETAKALMRGFKAYYNFIRPHQGLSGKTPAQKAGIALGLGENPWGELIRQSMRHTRLSSMK